MSATAPPRHALVILFDVFAFLGVALFTCTLLPAIFSKGVQRSIGWYSLMTAWLVFSLSYGLLVGRQEGPEPPFSLCLVQTLLIYAAPPLVAAGTLCYYIEFYLVISGLKSGNPRQPSSVRTFLLVSMPWLVFLAIVAEVVILIFFRGRRSLVQRAENNFYCHIGDGMPNQVTGSVIACCMLILIPLEVWTGLLMYRHWDVFKRLSQTDRQIFLTVYLRLTLCTLAAVIAFTFSALAVAFPAPDATSLVYPTLSIFVAFAFGTQKDILRAWLFWRRPQPYGSIVFNNGTATTATTYTSRAGIESQFFTGTQLQQQQYNKDNPTESQTTSSDAPLSTTSTASMMLRQLGSNPDAASRPVDAIAPDRQSVFEEMPKAKPSLS